MKELPKDPLDLVLSLIPHDPAKALEKILPEMCVAEIPKLGQPTAAQLQKLRSFEPYTTVGLAALKQQLAAGAIRFGPQHLAILSDFILPQLAGVGLSATIRQATREELKQARLIVEELPKHFRDSNELPPS